MQKQIQIRSQESEARSQKILVPTSPARKFEDLIVWQKAHEFVLKVYGYTEKFPSREIYGLANQLRKAAVSIPANIAEGFKKSTRPDKARFLNISQGSLEECRYYLILARDLGYGDSNELQARLEEVSKVLNAYLRSLLASDS
jgi:four helix bundle protein